MKTLQHIYIVLTALLLNMGVGLAQDAHLSQYYVSEPILNPALTGMFPDKDMRAIVQYRSQWGLVGSKFTTAAFSYDMPIKERWGVGGYLMNADGAVVFNTFNFVLSGAYRVTAPEQEKHLLTTGLQLGLINKQTRSIELLFDNQFTGENFDPDLPSGEDVSQMRLNKTLPEINFGIYYKYIDDTKKLNPYFGFSILHVTSPNESFLDIDKSKLPRRYVLHAGIPFKVNNELTLDPKLLYMKQSNATEINGGMEVSYAFGEEQATVLHVGGFYRMKDAVILSMGVTHSDFIYRLSYDFNTSSLEPFSNGRGGFELSIVYLR